jgi:hypothetical protein
MTKAAELAKMGEVLTNSQIGGRRNIVINGAMQVAQRATSVTGIAASTYATVDRWKTAIGNTAGRLTQTQTAITDLSGFGFATKLECTTADTSIAADETLMFHQRFEGQDLQQLKKGTSDAEKITVSFFVKGNASATYTCELQDTDNSRFNSQEFSVTTNFTRVILTFVADTTGALTNDNALSFQLNIHLHAGSTFTGGSHTDNVWHTTANQRVGDNQTSFFDSTDRTFFITGVQMEVGSQATPFEHRSFGEELALCQRYYELIGVGQPAKANSTTGIWCGMQFKTQKRASPSMSLTATDQRFFEFGISNRDTSSASIQQTYLNTKSAEIRLEGYSGITAGDTYLSGGLVSDTTADTFIAESEL